jgi:lipoprotein-anchoring transpeptidase ErfK/SrfK
LRYFFVGPGGASGFSTLEHALDDAPEQDLDPGFAVAIVEERTAHGEAWGRTRRGRWIAIRELAPVRPFAFHGEEIGTAGTLDFGWVLADRASVYGAAKADKPIGTRAKWDKVAWREEIATAGGHMVRISADGATPSEWLRVRDLIKPTSAPPPEEVDVASGERWIDVDLATQTLTAWEGARPVYATLVSTGKGPPKSETATPTGVHRLWVKLLTTPMDNLEKEDADHRYSIEDVPYVQFFDKAVALHGAFWHRGFGRVQSRGCVNLAPLDAKWLFMWTEPHVPAGWSEAFPTRLEPGTVVRVR